MEKDDKCCPPGAPGSSVYLCKKGAVMPGSGGICNEESGCCCYDCVGASCACPAGLKACPESAAVVCCLSGEECLQSASGDYECKAGSSSSASSSSSSLPPECTAVDLKMDKEDLKLGPEALRDYALKTLRKLVAASAARAGAPVSVRLSLSAKRVRPKLDILVKKAQASLDNLPEFLIVCSAEVCAKVDNSLAIAAYVRNVTLLAQSELRTLNRGTRLLGLDIKLVRQIEGSTGRAIKAERKRLIAKAKGIPSVSSMCAGG